jgi:hypothetical protein
MIRRTASIAIILTLLAPAFQPDLRSADPLPAPNPFTIDGGYDSGTKTLTRNAGSVIFSTTCDDDNGTSIWSIHDGSSTAEQLACDPDNSAELLFVDSSRILALKKHSEKFTLCELGKDADGNAALKPIADLPLEFLCIARLGKRLLLGSAGNGLYALQDGSGTLVQISGIPNAYVRCISIIGDRGYVGLGGKGVWTLEKEATTAKALVDHEIFSETLSIARVGNRIFIGGRYDEIGVLQDGAVKPDWIHIEHPDQGTQPWNHQPNLEVNSVAGLGKDVLFGTNYGIWLLKEGTNNCEQLGGISQFVDIAQIEVAGGIALVGTSGYGLWFYSGGAALKRVAAVPDEDAVLSIASRDSRFLVSTKRGIHEFRFSADGKPWTANCKLTWQVPGEKPIAPLTARIHVAIEDVSGWLDSSKAPIKITIHKNGIGKDTVVGQVQQIGALDVVVDLNEEGSYYATAQVLSALGQSSEEFRTPGQSLRVYPNAFAGWLDRATKIGICFAALWALATIGLIFASKWSHTAFRIVTSPAIPKLAQWYAPLFEFIRPVRLWMLEGFYGKMRAEFCVAKPFVDPTIETSNGQTGVLGALTSFFKPDAESSKTTKRLLLTGLAGTGKTTIIHAFLAKAVTPDALRVSWTEFGIVPFLVRVREHGSGKVTDAIVANLEGYGIDDEKLVRRLLRTGDFLVIFEGANERNWDDEIQSFAVKFPEVPIIITSQTDLDLVNMDRWRLPLFNAEFARKVLLVHLPENAADRTRKVPERLWPNIQCGYDVVLLAHLLLQDMQIPDSQVGLYESTLSQTEKSWAGPPPFKDVRAALYRKAMEQWESGSYELEPSDSLPQRFVDHLASKHVLSRVGARYQFRHELMRQYLAACWFVHESASTADLTNRLEDKAIWEVGRSQQLEVFSFLVELAPSYESLQALAGCVGKNIGQRAVLATAVQGAARKRECDINVPLG